MAVFLGKGFSRATEARAAKYRKMIQYNTLIKGRMGSHPELESRLWYALSGWNVNRIAKLPAGDTHNVRIYDDVLEELDMARVSTADFFNESGELGELVQWATGSLSRFTSILLSIALEYWLTLVQETIEAKKEKAP